MIINLANESFSNKDKDKQFWATKADSNPILQGQVPTAQGESYTTLLSAPKLELDPSIFDGAPRNEEELKTLLGRKWKGNICDLGAFVDFFQHITSKEITELHLSTTSPLLVNFYGSQRNVSNFLATAQKVKLLVCTENRFTFGNKTNFSKRYAYNKELEVMIKNIVKNHELARPSRIGQKFANRKLEEELGKVELSKLNGMYDGVEEEEEENVNGLCNDSINDSVNGLCKVSSHRPLVCPILLPLVETFADRAKFYGRLRIANSTDNEILESLYKKYPSYAIHLKLAEKLNAKLPPLEQIKFVPSIKRSNDGYVTKIGIRATSSICSLRKDKDGPFALTSITRDDYLASVFGNKKVYEYDVKNSIYRITYALNHGTWLGDETDLYALIHGPFENAEDRKHFKWLCMRMYFDTPCALFSHIKDLIPNCLAEYGEETCRQELTKTRDMLVHILGGRLYNNEVFYVESCLYLQLLEHLMSLGIRVVQVYDAFYSDVDLAPIIKAILPVLWDKVKPIKNELQNLDK